MSFTHALWTMIGTFLTGTNHYLSAYSRVGKTIDRRAEIFEEDQLHQLKAQRIENEAKLKALGIATNG